MGDISYDNIISYNLGNNHVLFFDIFARNNKIICISPSYNDIDNINIICNSINLYDKIIDKRNSHVAIIYFTIPFDIHTSELNIIVNYYQLQLSYNIIYKNFIDKQYKLIQTTLFKDDYYLLEMFVNYYIEQGIEMFYLYYNGSLKRLMIPDTLIQKNIKFLEWDYIYYISGDYKTEATGHAQPGQLIHSLLKYGKFQSEYMLFNDLDEYICVPNNKLYTVLDSNEYDTIVFHNNWADTIDNSIPLIFPRIFLIHNKVFPYHSRSKCIHKTTSIDTLHSVHGNDLYNIPNPKTLDDMNYLLFHFYSWSPANPTHATRDKNYISRDEMVLYHYKEIDNPLLKSFE